MGSTEVQLRDREETPPAAHVVRPKLITPQITQTKQVCAHLHPKTSQLRTQPCNYKQPTAAAPADIDQVSDSHPFEEMLRSRRSSVGLQQSAACHRSPHRNTARVLPARACAAFMLHTATQRKPGPDDTSTRRHSFCALKKARSVRSCGSVRPSADTHTHTRRRSELVDNFAFFCPLVSAFVRFP